MVIKQKYFPQGDFLAANLGYRLSNVWKSLLAGKEPLNRGLIWRVRNGKNIKIWTDPWIPKPISNQIQSPIQCLRGDATFDKLMNEGEHQWNLTLIQQCFSSEDTNLISNIPLTITNMENKLV